MSPVRLVVLVCTAQVLMEVHAPIVSFWDNKRYTMLPRIDRFLLELNKTHAVFFAEPNIITAAEGVFIEYSFQIRTPCE